MKKTELLAPAGNYECFSAAVKAGADAVYLGGPKFGARAFADNFTADEVCKAIRFAHLWNRKVYLTVNTLLKDRELEELGEYILPFYQCGLDGVIVQDIGVLCYIRDHFPGLKIHCSTQMTITGVYGASMARKMGADRIVPARELSLNELREIRDSVDIEIEAFIHGAMCYCYSGQCLFSSILGGRSGNRGRCAQPCRLPYRCNRNDRNEIYPLSLKDMCMIENLPELMEAGITSFKIEGRMKSPEYVAGVTGIYRKYMDLYYENPDRKWKVTREDLEILHSLYIRSQVQNGYYFRQNGREMITMNRPGYSGNPESVIQKVRENFLKKELKLPVSAECRMKLSRSAELTLTCGKESVTVSGETVLPAKNRPLTEEDIRSRIDRTGNTGFFCERIDIDADENIFYSLKSLNELRRNGIQALEKKILDSQFPEVCKRKMIRTECGQTESPVKPEKKGKNYVSVRTEEQLRAVSETAFGDTLILDSSMYSTREEWDRFGEKLLGNRHLPVYIAMPYVIRNYDSAFLDGMLEVLNSEWVAGCMFRNLETYSFLREKKYSGELIGDANIYIFNHETYDFWNRENVFVTYPYELNAGETGHLYRSGVYGIKDVYGRIPMMITANCIQKTMDGCNKKSSVRYLTDRYKISFPVVAVCKHCYNIIYNSAPLSLHNTYADLLKYTDCRLSFTTETGEETKKILDFYKSLTVSGKTRPDCPISGYTTGHEKRGVE